MNFFKYVLFFVKKLDKNFFLHLKKKLKCMYFYLIILNKKNPLHF